MKFPLLITFALVAALIFAAFATSADGETYVHRLITDGGGNWWRVYVPVRCEFVYLRSDAVMYRLHDEFTGEKIQHPTAGWMVYDTRTGRVTKEDSPLGVGPGNWVSQQRGK